MKTRKKEDHDYVLCITIFLTNSRLLSVYSDIHTEAVQAALAKHKEEKMALPMPTKRRSTYVQSPIETRTPPGRSPYVGLRHFKIILSQRSKSAANLLVSFLFRLFIVRG